MISSVESPAEDARVVTALQLPIGGGCSSRKLWARRCRSIWVQEHLQATLHAHSAALMLGFRNALAPSRTHGLRILQHLSKPSSMSMATGNPTAAAAAKPAQTKKHLIEKKLTEGLAPALLQVEDVSHQHAGHAGAPKGSSETHFNVTVVSDQFQGRNLLKRHRLVYDLLHDELQHGGVHALSLNTKTPAEVAPKP